MRHWWQISTRNWRTRPGRSGLSVLAVALGVGVVVWVTCCYESVRLSITEAVLDWIGRSHVIVEPVEGVWAVFDERAESLVSRVPGVSATTVRTREYVEAASGPPAAKRPPDDAAFCLIETTGVLPDREERFRNYRMTSGRFLLPGDRDAVVVEQLYAAELNLKVGQTLWLRDADQPEECRPYRVVGIVDRRRASVNQPPMVWMTIADVQALCHLPGQIKAVDALLSDPTVESIRRVAEEIRRELQKHEEELVGGPHQTKSLQVKTTEAQLQKLAAAQGLLQFIMALLSCVVLLTAFFIILASISMGVTERVTELGLLRCVGATRSQIAVLILLHGVPLGLVGTLIGIPLGLGLQWLTIRAAGDYVGRMVFSPWGVALGVCGGIGTTLLGAALPAFGAFGVSPVEAARPHAGGRLLRWTWISALVGTGLLGIYAWLARTTPNEDPSAVSGPALASILLLYGGFALISPAVVVALGRATVALTARLLRLRPQLLGEEIDKSPFRTAAICSGLMVGLSLIVGLIVWGRSVKQGWRFPQEFPDALLYSYEALPLEKVRALKDTPGIAQFAVADDFSFSLSRPSVFRPLRLLDEFSRFLAVDPDEGFSVARLAFLEGSEREARAKLRAGGHVLITREFAQARGKRLGDRLTIWVDQRKADFTIAGVVASPGLDIAISFFNATTYFQTYAVGAVVGTLADAERCFGRRYGKLMLINFTPAKLDAGTIPYSGAQSTLRKKQPAGAGARPNFALGPGPVPGDGPEERIINRMLDRLGYPSKAFVTARELKQLIDRSIDRVTLLLAVIPIVALVVSALGLANVMAANVASRARQIAVLRAIGLTRGQLVRIVIGEALVIGLLGSVLGVGLGLALAHSSNKMTLALSGIAPQFTIPWPTVLIGAALATVLCLLAALVPARYAGRTNIVGVLAGS